MSRWIQSYLLLASLLAVEVPTLLAEVDLTRRANPTPVLSVRVYNLAAVDDTTLSDAKQAARRIFRKAGIEIRWVDCPLTPATPGYHLCGVLASGPTVLAVKILNQRMAESYNFSPLAFGFALPTTGDQHALHAGVFAHRVHELGWLRTPSKGVILGHVMAHEIGHLLLGPGSHSRAGIMQLPWSKNQLQMASEGSLLFRPKEVKKMHQDVHRRLAAKPPTKPARASGSGS